MVGRAIVQLYIGARRRLLESTKITTSYSTKVCILLRPVQVEYLVSVLILRDVGLNLYLVAVLAKIKP